MLHTFWGPGGTSSGPKLGMTPHRLWAFARQLSASYASQSKADLYYRLILRLRVAASHASLRVIASKCQVYRYIYIYVYTDVFIY